MCTRFFINDEVIQKAYMLSEYQTQDIGAVRCGDFHPSEKAIVIAGRNSLLAAGTLTWGFPRPDGKGLVVNARSETIHEKRMFMESAARRRCIIPAAGFYEWDAHKEVTVFTREQSPVIYLAGIFQSGRFTVLTTDANDSVRPVHPRMPVILEEDEIRSWIFDLEAYPKLLKKPMPQLSCLRDNQQLSLF